MRSIQLACLAFTLSLTRVAAAQGLQAGPNPALDHAVRAFWESGSERDLRRASSEILRLNPDPDAAWRRMAGGRLYSARVGKGRLNLEHKTLDGMSHRYTLVVPSTYDPAVAVPLRIYLHGGVNTEDRNSARLWDFDRFTAGDGLALYPSAWRGAMWWTPGQVENILGTVLELKRTYNIDENRIHMIGASDGGTGAFYFAFKVATPFAGFVTLVGHGGALTNPRLGAGGGFYVTNLSNSPFFMVNGALDPLFPVRAVAPYVALYRQAGVNVVFRPRPEAGHDLRWWPEVAAAVDSFLAATPRDPHPDTLRWETDEVERFNRAWWIRVDSLGTISGETVFPGYDSVVPLRAEPSLGVRADPGSTQGVRVMSVELGSIAGRAGLQAGDRIVAANGQPTPNVPALLQASQGLGWGDSLAVIIERENTAILLRVFFGPEPGPASPAPVVAFPRHRPSGRVEAVREGNAVHLRTSGIRQLTLLLSPDEFNLEAPITVTANGRPVYSGVVEKSVETMLEWATRDRDRKMLYLAELTIRLDN